MLGLKLYDVTRYLKGRGGGLVVSVPTSCSVDPSSNPAGYLINFLYIMTEINKIAARFGPIFKTRFFYKN